MSLDPLEQLAIAAVPPPPDDFDRSVHQRLNRTLLAGQLVELACVAPFFALAELARAAAAAAAFTLSGRYPAGTMTIKNQQEE